MGGPGDGADGKFFRIEISLLYIPIGCSRGFSMFYRFGSSSGGALSAGSVQNPTLISRFSPQRLKLSPGAWEEFNSGNSSFPGAF